MCNRFSHIAPECKIKPVVGNVSDGKCSSEQSKGKPVCFVSTIPSNSIIDSRVSNSPSTLTLACQRTPNCIMPIYAGYVNESPVTVLRDTGCSGIVVWKTKVGDQNFIDGKQQVCFS